MSGIRSIQDVFDGIHLVNIIVIVQWDHLKFQPAANWTVLPCFMVNSSVEKLIFWLHPSINNACNLLGSLLQYRRQDVWKEI